MMETIATMAAEMSAKRAKLGISFILLAGGEPMLRKDVIEAAGRGFFHINSHGGAEPCPFSPYSDVNIKNTSLKEAMYSPLFTALRNGDILMEDHAGGCVLYEKREQVEALLAAGRG